MFGLPGSESLFYAGIFLMLIVVVSAVICMIMFRYTGKKLKKKLDEEYGVSQRHHT